MNKNMTTKPRRPKRPPNPLLEHALQYAKQGWPVFPLHTPEPSKEGCSCSRSGCIDQGKHPRTENGFKDATTDEDQIRSWWKKWPNANIGLVTGKKSGFIVLDVDSGGDKELAKQTVPDTAESTTGNGRHLYFTYPGKEVKNSKKFLPGLDLRADGGYIVAPPSLHLSGKKYIWQSGKMPTKNEFAPCPKGILEKAKNSKNYGKGYTVESEDLYAQFCSTVMDSSDLIKKEIPRPEKIISPWLTAGSITEIYSPRGVGKTFLSLIIAIAVTRAKYTNIEIGPWKVTRPTGVLYIDGEMEIYQIKKRVEQLTLPLNEIGNKENKDYPLTIFSSNYFGQKHRKSININQKDWQNVIYKFLKKNRNYKLLVLDNLSALTPGLDENSNKEWGEINQWLLSLRSLGVAVIFVHHAGKGGQQRGASAREDNVDCVIKLKDAPGKKPNQAHFIISFEKSRNVGPSADLKPFTLKLEDCKTGPGLVWTTEKTEIKKANKIKAMLIDGKLKQKEISTQFSVTPGYVSQKKADLKKDGLLDNNNKPTENGLAFRGKVDLEDLDDAMG